MAKKKLTHTFSMDSKLYAVVFAQSEQNYISIIIINIYIIIYTYTCILAKFKIYFMLVLKSEPI